MATTIRADRGLSTQVTTFAAIAFPENEHRFRVLKSQAATMQRAFHHNRGERVFGFHSRAPFDLMAFQPSESEPDSHMYVLRRMSADDRPALNAMTVADDQLLYVDPVAETLAATGSQRDNFVMEDAGTVVGFFQLDSSLTSGVCKDCLILHEVSVGAQHQGKGYGKAFALALSDCLKREYPDFPTACLTVNCKNHTARRLYELAGFVDTGDVYQEGRSGPQNLMRLALG